MRWTRCLVGSYLLLTLLFLNIEAASVARARRSIDPIELRNYLQTRSPNLPEEVVPVAYRLDIEPLLDKGKFKGRAKINVTWTDTGDRITFNLHPDIEVAQNDVKVTQHIPEEKEGVPSSMSVNIARIDRVTKKTRQNLFVIHLEQMMKKGNSCEVDISFTASISRDGYGFHERSYYNNDSKEHKFYATRLQLDRAQMMFPCMDEPQYKATFQLNVKHNVGFIARSNTPVEFTTEIEGEPGVVWDHFEKTPVMAPYQLSLLLSEFENIDLTKNVDKLQDKQLEVKIWGRKEFLSYLKDRPSNVVDIINYLQMYFNSSIGLKKLDIVALPSMTVAREEIFDNWGMIYFPESEMSSPLIRKKTNSLIYQWIGQYITPFAWLEARTSRALNSFLATTATLDLNPDELEGKWPITMLYSLYYEFGKVEPSSAALGIKDDTSSAATELFFRTFNYTLGKDKFREAIRRFVRTCSNTPRAYFERQIYEHLDALANETGTVPENVYSIANVWIHRDRVPLVTVVRDYDNSSVSFSQKVYFRDGTPVISSGKLAREMSYQWHIPIVMLSQKNLNFSQTKPLTWLIAGRDSGKVTVEDIADEDSFIIVNPEEIGMFPVNYDPCNWKMLARYLQGPKRETIPILTRAKLLHDAWNLAYAGELCFGIALNMTLFLKDEKSHVVWEPIFTMIDHVGRRIENSDVYPKFEAYIRHLLKSLYTELGEASQPGEPHWKTHMRTLIKNFLCRAGYEPCVKEARAEFKKWLEEDKPDNRIPIPSAYICPVFKWGTMKEWEQGFDRLMNFSNDPRPKAASERTYLLKALAGCPKHPEKIERLLNNTILRENPNITDADIYLIFRTLSGGSAGYTTLFHFLADHWDNIKDKFENKTVLWDRIVNSATSFFNNQEGYDMVSELYLSRTTEFESAETIIKEAMERIKRETEWGENNLPVIDAWLKENLPKTEEECCYLDENKS